jgi:hypothetical protein
MAPDELKAARSRHTVAYESYQHVTKRITDKLAAGLIPSADEIREEAQEVITARSAPSRSSLSLGTTSPPLSRGQTVLMDTLRVYVVAHGKEEADVLALLRELQEAQPLNGVNYG